LEKALRPKVWLKSGGYIVINQTEALVAIDVNTGKYVGKSNRLEDTIVKTNTDAIKEIVRQIRLRDLGGIVVVDFIDMDERKNRQKVMQALEEAMRADRAPYKILQFNDFGLVAITRKRVKQSLERTLCTPCPYCEGAGYVKSPQTMIGEILQEAQKLAKDALLRVSPDVAKLLKSNQNSFLQEIEEVLGRPVIVKSDSQLHQEKFDLT
jgi:ribonuclease G